MLPPKHNEFKKIGIQENKRRGIYLEGLQESKGMTTANSRHRHITLDLIAMHIFDIIAWSTSASLKD